MKIVLKLNIMVLLFLANVIVAQSTIYHGETLYTNPKTPNELVKTPLIYLYHIDSLAISLNPTNANISAFKAEIQIKTPNKQLLKTYRDGFENKVLHNNNTLNVLFSDEVATYFNGGSDLSLQKFYTSIDTDESSLSFGVNFDTRKESKLKKLTWLLNGGFKAKAAEKFSTFAENGKLQSSDIAITGKMTWIGKGILNCSGKKGLKRPDIIISYREKLIDSYTNKIQSYVDDDYKKEEDSLFTVYNSDFNKKEYGFAKYQELIHDKYLSYYEKIANDETKFMKENKLYKFIRDSWWTIIDFSVPLGQKEYNYSLAETNPNFETVSFYPITLSSTATVFWKWSSGQSLYFTGQISAYNNNNILVDEMTTTPFKTVTSQSATQFAETKNDEVYVLKDGFDRFITGVGKLEAVFFINNWIGISPAIEQNVGQYYNPFNLKIGIPFSLKDKDGKPLINFELQYKKVNDKELVGISASFLFGKFLK